MLFNRVFWLGCAATLVLTSAGNSLSATVVEPYLFSQGFITSKDLAGTGTSGIELFRGYASPQPDYSGSFDGGNGRFGSATVSAVSLPGYGELRAGVDGTFSVYSSTNTKQNIESANLQSLAGFGDKVTVSGSGTGYLVMTYSVTGTGGRVAGSGGASNWYYLRAGVVTDSGSSTGLNYSSSLHTSTYAYNDVLTTSMLPIPFGIPINIWGNITAATVYNYSCITCTQSTVSAYSDFTGTARLSGIAVYDSNSNLVSDWTISSTSGQLYTAQGAVPEPATLGLCAAAVVLLVHRGRRAVM